MRRVGVLVLGLVAVLLAVPAVSGAPWLQPRGDAAATGYQPGAGPERPDVALRVQLEGDMRAEGDAPPLILEDRVIFLARPALDQFDGAYHVLSMDFATGDVTKVGQLPFANDLRIATDGETVYAAGPMSVHAFPLESEGEEWTWSWEPRLGNGADRFGCSQMALEENYVTVLCFEGHDFEDQRGTDEAGAGAWGQPIHIMLVARLEAETGELVWVWDHPNVPNPRQHLTANVVFPEGLAVSRGRVIVESVEGTGTQGAAGAGIQGRGPNGYGTVAQARVVVRALDVDPDNSPRPAWGDPWKSDSMTLYPSPSLPDEAPGVADIPRVLVGNPAVSDDTVYVKAQGIRALNLGTGRQIWNEPIGKEDSDPGYSGGTGLALAQGQVHAATSQTLYGIDADDPEDRWSKTLALAADQQFDEAPIVTRDAVYGGAASQSSESPDVIYAFGPSGGDFHWAHDVENNLFSFSVGTGLLAYTEVGGGNGTLNTTMVVLGKTEASPEPVTRVSTAYPDEGEPVRVNLSASEAGLQGPVTRYKAHWGDGTTSGWQQDPVLTHAYDDAGDVKARFVVGNEANQTASTTRTFHVGEEPPVEDERFAPDGSVSLDLSELDFESVDEAERYRVFWGDGNVTAWQEDPVFRHEYAQDGNVTARIQAVNADNETSSQHVTMRVGQSPPPEPNLAQKAFAPENQDMTFGILGVVLAVGGGAVGVARRRRKRSRLEQELEALEEGFEEAKHNPGECEAFLETRKGRARSLLVDGTLTEEQVNVLENRIEELRREMRTGVLDERFQFLPYGMVQSLKGMLADGEISTWERSTLEDLLEEDETLNKAQRERVRGLLERWSEDAGGGGVG